MDIDWKRLGDVRERQKTVAQQRVAEERRVTEQSWQQAEQAHQQWQQRIAAKEALWQQATGRSGGAVSVAQMRQAGAWSHALDAQIVQAGAMAQQAEGVARQQQSVLDASRLRLRQAAADLEKARQMQQRSRTEQARRSEQRLEDGAEEAAVQGWLSRRI